MLTVCNNFIYFLFLSIRLLNEVFDKEEGKTRLEKEFDNIQETIHREPVVFTGTASPNRHKNRYANVIPCKYHNNRYYTQTYILNFLNVIYTLICVMELIFTVTIIGIVDKTRCKLSTIPGVDGSDYINANFIEVLILPYTYVHVH